MVLQDLKVIFDNTKATFLCGQNVSGRLVVQLDAPKYLSSILVKFKGEANCSWNESKTVSRNGKNEMEETVYKDHDLYFETHLTLFGGSGNTEVLPAGSHFFQFSMVIPNHLPASFEGKHGHIRYTVKGILHRPWKYDHEVMATFTILPSLDLNLDPNYRTPVHAEKSKTFCCCCCKSGPLSLLAYIPSKGYVPGQTIPVTIEVENGSNVKILKVICELLKTVYYYSSSPHGTKQDCAIVAALTFDEQVRSNESKSWTGSIRIPPGAPSMLQSCSIIDQDYKLVVKAVPKGMHESLKHNLPIVVGTIPLLQSTCSQLVSEPSAPPDVTTSFVQPAVFMDTPPPPYEEWTQERTGFCPQYAVQSALPN